VADNLAASDQERRSEIERTLHESELQFRLLVDSVADYAIFMLDTEGRIVTWNSGAARIKGYDVGEIIGHDHARFYTEEDRAMGMPALALQSAREHGRHESEGWRVRKDGGRFRANVVVEAIRDNDGQLIGYSTVTRDITERREAQARDARFRRVVETAPNAIVMINSAGLIEMVNAQAEQIFGYDRTEMLGQHVEMLVPQRFRANHPALRRSFLTDPHSRPMGAGRDLFGLRKDGSEFPIEIGLNPIETEEGTMVLSAIVDISARKRLEERFRRVVEAAPSAMVMINASGRIEMVNAQAEQVFGYARAEMLGQPVEMLVPQRFRGHHPGLRGSFFADPQARPMGAGRDLYGLAKDGTEFPVEIGLNPIETEEGPMVLSAIVDISDRKQKEERIQLALKEKDVLLGEVHHRVKNNLQIVHSLLDLQSSRITDRTALDMLRDSQNRIRSMGLIHQTLYQSKDFAKVDFSRFLDSLVPTLVGSYGVNPDRIALSVKAEQVLFPINAAIPCGLVVNELISNALKHAFPGDRTGEIRVRLSTGSDGATMLSVADDGVGIPQGVELGRTSTLGLQLVSLLADQLGGKIAMRRSDPTELVLSFAIEP
jgi:PAS domain S-box-containing protein